MNPKIKNIILMLLPILEVAANIIAARDENSTGVDDEIAEGIKHLVERLRQYDLS